MTAAPRHEVLFELLRRQNMADTAHRRVMAEPEREAIEAAEAAQFLASALASWEVPERFAPAPETEAEDASAPEPGRHDEFFRAVGA